MGMKDNIMLRALMLEDVDQERGYKIEKEIKEKLQKYVDAYEKIIW